jgi:molybdopterin-guanine dinucleotide biosynthesis protein B
MVPIISVVGKSDSGKTTLIEKLIPELRGRGYKIGVVKHAFHGFEMDHEGKDSWRHKIAGANTVVVSTKERIAMIKDAPDNTLDQIMAYFQDMDLVITEGYKREDKLKIEVFRAEAHHSLLCQNDPHLVALVTDADPSLAPDVPRFGLEDIRQLADFIENQFL